MKKVFYEDKDSILELSVEEANVFSYSYVWYSIRDDEVFILNFLAHVMLKGNTFKIRDRESSFFIGVL